MDRLHYSPYADPRNLGHVFDAGEPAGVQAVQELDVSIIVGIPVREESQLGALAIRLHIEIPRNELRPLVDKAWFGDRRFSAGMFEDAGYGRATPVDPSLHCWRVDENASTMVRTRCFATMASFGGLVPADIPGVI